MLTLSPMNSAHKTTKKVAKMMHRGMSTGSIVDALKTTGKRMMNAPVSGTIKLLSLARIEDTVQLALPHIYQIYPRQNANNTNNVVYTDYFAIKPAPNNCNDRDGICHTTAKNRC